VGAAFDPWKRIYDLYGFDAAYDLEPRGLSESLQDYGEDVVLDNRSSAATGEDKEDLLEGLDLMLEEAGPRTLTPSNLRA